MTNPDALVRQIHDQTERVRQMLTTTKTFTWSDERRARQREAIHRTKPWLSATGPRTSQGKAIVARNACRPDSARQQVLQMMRELREVMRLAKAIEARRRVGHGG